MVALTRVGDWGPAPGGLVDREHALGAVADTLDAVEADGGRTLLVSGAAGVGKSALLGAARERAAGRGFAVHAARCRPDAGDPFGPIVRAFRGADTGVVGHLRGRDVPVPRDPEAFTAQRNAQFNDVADELRAMATINPVALVVDDLQWAERATLALLSHFAEAIREWIYPVMVVGAHRPLATLEAERAAVLEEVGGIERNRTVALDPLDRNGVADLAASLLAADPPAGFVDRLADATGGNPLFVRELLADWREGGRLDPKTGQYPTGERPGREDMAGVVTARRDRRGERERTALAAAAALGTHVPLELLGATLDRSTAALSDTAATLAHAGFWHHQEGAVTFGSGTVREGVGAPDGADPAWHRRAADHLADTDDGTTGAAFAVARERAAAGERRQARERYAEAADRAMAELAPEVAVRARERAHSLAAGGNEEAACEHALAAGRALLVLGAYEAAGERFQTARGASDDPAFRARTYAAEADLAFHRGRFEGSVQAADEGLAEGDDLPPSVRRNLLGVRGRAAVQGGELATARTAHRRALEVASDDRERAEALTDLAVAERRAGDLGEARSLLTDAIDHAASVGDEGVATVARRKLAIVDNQRGDVEAAAESYRQVIATLQDRGDVSDLSAAMMDLGACYYNLGRLEEALSRWETTIEMAERVGREDIQALSMGNAGLVLLNTGEVDRAREHIERSVELLADRGQRDRAALRRGTLAYLQFLTGEGHALETVEDALSTARDTSQKFAIGNCLQMRGRLRRVDGDVAGAVADHEEGAAVAADLGNTRLEARNRSQLAEDHVAADRPEDALAAAERALDLVEATGQVLFEARTRARLGKARWAAEDLAGAEAALTAALDPQRERGQVAEACWTLVERARVARDREAHDAARSELSTATDLASEAGFEQYVERAERVRSTLDDG